MSLLLLAERLIIIKPFMVWIVLHHVPVLWQQCRVIGEGVTECNELSRDLMRSFLRRKDAYKLWRSALGKCVIFPQRDICLHKPHVNLNKLPLRWFVLTPDSILLFDHYSASPFLSATRQQDRIDRGWTEDAWEKEAACVFDRVSTVAIMLN